MARYKHVCRTNRIRRNLPGVAARLEGRMTIDEGGVGQIDVGARGTEYLVARVLHCKNDEPSEPPRIGVLHDGHTLTIDAPAPGETVTVTIEAVDDHC